MNWRTSLTVGVAALAIVSSIAGPKDVIERAFDAKATGKLKMDVDRGSIHITTSASDKVQVRVVRELRRTFGKNAREVFDAHKIDFTEAGDTIEIRADNPQRVHFWRKDPFNNLQVEYTVAVPAEFHLDLHTRGGNIDVEALDGTMQAKTDGGSITAARIGGPSNLQTGGGNVRIDRVGGDLVASTGGGSINIRSAAGSVEADSGGGNIEVHEARGAINARTGGGSVTAAWAQQPKSNSSLKTGGGNVSVSLPRDSALTLTARTGGGRIDSDFAGDGNKSQTKLVASINGGGPDLLLETGGGNVRIAQK